MASNFVAAKGTHAARYGKFQKHRPPIPPGTCRTMFFRLLSKRACCSSATAMDGALHSGSDVPLIDFTLGKGKATDVAHSVWRHVVRKGDFVIDATCGNGHDTLALAEMVCEESGKGLVAAMDVQQSALQSTASLLDSALSLQERKQVKLYRMCHSKLENLVPEGALARLVAFNLGFLPGGNKELVTMSETTVQALNAATRVLGSGGLISITAYVGHPGGWEEYQAVRGFASKLPAIAWICSGYEILNRPSAPVLIFLFKR